MIKFKKKYIILCVLMPVFLVKCENEKEVLRYEDIEVVRVITDENGEIIQEDAIRGVDGLS